MQDIHKYLLPMSRGSHVLELYQGFKILDIQLQNKEVVLWVSENSNTGWKTEFKVYVYFTGEPVQPYLKYLKTVQLPSGIVLHYYTYHI